MATVSGSVAVAARCGFSAALVGLTIKLPQLQGLKTHN